MKKILILCLSILMIFSMTSCKALDEKKARYATWSEDQSSITYQGQVYMKVSMKNASDLYSFESARLSVCDADVPLLLSDLYGSYGVINGAKTVLHCDGNLFALESELDYLAHCFDSPRFAPQVWGSAEEIPLLDEDLCETVFAISKEAPTFPGLYIWSEGVVVDNATELVICDVKKYIYGPIRYDLFEGQVAGEKGVYLSAENRGIYKIPEANEKGFSDYIKQTSKGAYEEDVVTEALGFD